MNIVWTELLVAVLLLASGGVVLTAALGLWRLPDFFARMHAPALASTLAAWLVAAATILHFSTREGELSLHVWLAVALLSITAPVTTIVLARAALFRRRHAGDELPPPLAGELPRQARDLDAADD
ncbi:monovalent cation/H(+) antiporter subunit G [Rubrivivax gelatinosus]|uniref:Multisubunit potassium/proton antiporter PhaG subunit n=1 Tax=Rubrivivax gelatinosus TaxID=28068 RepID=A0A4R2M3S8_RUBGE|nr:monovalent cation/H(+) antiporter subunit G [Rubrivivax gelatinosus]MBK1689669.1 Na+/H+ antiporter subunit G [Rubrivivax gelatinosus]TCP01809.1 multisubunit potassium/proton antiporter PhaG subunit [Rubrivivax gelatinosus]